MRQAIGPSNKTSPGRGIWGDGGEQVSGHIIRSGTEAQGDRNKVLDLERRWGLGLGTTAQNQALLIMKATIYQALSVYQTLH